MLIVSDSIKQAMKQPIKSLRSKIIIHSDSKQQEITDQSGLISFNIESDGYLFGTSISIANIKFLGTNYDLIGQDISLVTSVLTDPTNDTWEDIIFGKFRAVEQTINLEKEETSLKCLDSMAILAQTQYNAGELAFPCSLSDLAGQIINKFGLNSQSDLETLANHEYTIEEDLYSKISNITYRDVLAEIAGATATIVITNQNNVRFVEPQRIVQESLTYDNLIKVKFQPKYGKINSVVLARTPQEDNIVVKDDVSIEANGLTEVKLANNEILDDNRELLAPQILDMVNGFEFYPFEARTEGHGYYQCGDRVSITDGVNVWESIITHIKLEIGQVIKETISGIAPKKEQTDYARAGGILKTIYNTEIKVDKQKQEISSIVSKTVELDDKINSNHTEIIQNINSITNTIQTTGGANLLYNSVGFATDTNNVPTIWVKTGSVVANTSAESLTFGAISGNQIILSANSSISQSVIVTPNNPVSLSMRVKKGFLGSATITISTNDLDKQIIQIEDQKEYIWKEMSFPNLIPNLTNLTVKIETKDNTEQLSITDLMLNIGDNIIPWQQASGEILNANVLIDKDGVIVKNSVYSGDYMKITPIEFANYSNASGSEEKTFWLNRDMTNVHKLQVAKQITMPPIRVIPITEGSRMGWCFIADKGEN